MIAGVKAHLRRVGPLRGGVDLAYLLEPDNLGPELVRLLDVADIENQVVQADRPRWGVWHFNASFAFDDERSIARPVLAVTAMRFRLEGAMHDSRDRILTSHAGSLPRPDS